MNRDRLPIKPQAGLQIEEFDVCVRDDHPIRIRVYRQLGSEDFPLLIYMHGGGYVTGGLETDDRYCRKLAAEVAVVVLSIEYRLAPEHKFPIGFGDAYDVVKWVRGAQSLLGKIKPSLSRTDNSSKATLPSSQAQLHAKLTKGFVLGGTSAGANFTAGISHLARDENLSPPLSGLVFLAGSFCHPDARPERYRDRILSVDEIDDAPGLTRKSINYFAGPSFLLLRVYY
jgi:acetyl esterase/lipase